MAITQFYPSNTTSSSNTYNFINGKARQQHTAVSLNTNYGIITNYIPCDKSGYNNKHINQVYFKINSVNGSQVNCTISSKFTCGAAWNGYNSRCQRRIYVQGNLEQTTASISSATKNSTYNTTAITKNFTPNADGKIHIQFNFYGYNDNDSWCPPTFYQDLEIDVNAFLATKIKLKQNGSWVDGEVWAKNGGVWIKATAIYAKDGGTWKETK